MPENVARKLSELYDLREAVETHAVLVLTEQPSAGGLRKLQTSIAELASVRKVAEQHDWTRENADRWLMADASFHWSLLEACGNQSLLRQMNEGELMPGVFVWRSEYVAQAEHMRIQREHDEVLTAVSEGDVERAREVLVRHIRRGLEVSLGAVRGVNWVDP